MAENFRKTVAMPEQAAKKLRKIIEQKKPLRYVQAQRAKKNATGNGDKFATAKDAAAVTGLAAAQGMGWLAAGGAQFLLTLARWLTLDNAALRKMEEKFAKIDVGKNKHGRPKKMSAFAKKYPNLSAHILWYFMLASLIGGGRVATQYGPDLFQEYKEWKIDDQAENQARGTYKAFLDKMRPITPFLIADLIVKEGVHVDENGMHVPYRDSRGIPTIGFGSTMLKDGSRVTMDTPPMTTDEAYELARWHLEDGETYFVLYCYDVANDAVDINTTNEALGMSSVVYNAYSKLIENPRDKNHQMRFDELRKLYDEYGYAVPDSLVKNVFAKYPITDATSFGKAWLGHADINTVADKLGGFLAGGRGLYWRRWLEAGLLTGDITPQMLLDCPVNGMYEFFKVMGQKKSAFFTGDENNRRVNKKTYEVFKQWLENPKNERNQSLKNWPKVSNYLPSDILAFCSTGECALGNKEFAKLAENKAAVEKETYVIGYDEAYKNAIASYKTEQYTVAAMRFEKMVHDYPDNALLRNDLAATYNLLGRYDDAITQAREVLYRIADKSQYAAAQYNAGYAYERQGDFERALKNYELSVANGNRRVQNDVNRLRKKLKDKKMTAFNRGADNLKPKRGDVNFADVIHNKNYIA